MSEDLKPTGWMRWHRESSDFDYAEFTVNAPTSADGWIPLYTRAAPPAPVGGAFQIIDNAIASAEEYEPDTAGGDLRIVPLRMDQAKKVRAALGAQRTSKGDDQVWIASSKGINEGGSEPVAPFGWAAAKQGNYFTRSKSIADRIGGLIPVYAAPQPVAIKGEGVASAGYQSVPVKPSIAMCIRGAAAADNEINGQAAAQVYAAMLHAAPQPSASPAALTLTAQAAPEADDVQESLDWIDDFIARCNGDDRGACESVNVLRRALAAPQPSAKAQQAGAAEYCASCDDGLCQKGHGAQPSAKALTDERIEQAADAIARDFLRNPKDDDRSTIATHLRALLTEQPSTEQADEDAYVIDRLSKLLAGVAIALKGDEQPLMRHSYHDLPEMAATLKLELDLYRANAEQPSEYKRDKGGA
ncbi:hypothetical protein [Cupriavidus basilensis]|uniref:hypothetical protein n=1 Tax=Cupriavidus basilensis TaxID=68895 RepID=UPI0020A61EA3|nr:hypothetical protein [Cupriavidus basilensis]MCP3017985.1 hypothetical protein [Cupriavidus basilensis]